MTERRLRVRTRSQLRGDSRESKKWCLFARLSLRTARDLFEDAALTATDHLYPSNGWSILSSSSWNIEFLPLKIVFDSGDFIYSSYNGGSLEGDGTLLKLFVLAIFFRPEMSQFQNCHYHRTHTC